MTNSDWLTKQAEMEKNSRLYGGKPPRSGCLHAVVSAIVWSIGIVVGLSVLVAAAGFLLERYGSDSYVLVCSGSVSYGDGLPDVNASMYLDVREFGQIIRIWSKDSGTVRIEIPNDFYAAGSLKQVGTLTSITTYDSLSGHYSPLSGSLTMRLDKRREFLGQCARRKDQ